MLPVLVRDPILPVPFSGLQPCPGCRAKGFIVCAIMVLPCLYCGGNGRLSRDEAMLAELDIAVSAFEAAIGEVASEYRDLLPGASLEERLAAAGRDFPGIALPGDSET